MFKTDKEHLNVRLQKATMFGQSDKAFLLAQLLQTADVHESIDRAYVTVETIDRTLEKLDWLEQTCLHKDIDEALGNLIQATKALGRAEEYLRNKVKEMD